jgi:phospholipase D1/2
VHYFAGRMLHRDTVRKLAGEKLNSLMHVLRQRGLLAITALRLIPVAPFAVEGFVAGAVRIKVWHFLLGTFIGILPGALAATVFADQLETALDDTEKINWWLVAGVAILFVLTVVLVRRWFKRQAPEQSKPQPRRKSYDARERIDPVILDTRAEDSPRELVEINADRS